MSKSADTVIANADLSYVVPYQKAYGFEIAVDGVQNMPKANIYFAVISIVPPSTLYDASPAGRPNPTWTLTSIDPTSTMKSPNWIEGFRV